MTEFTIRQQDPKQLLVITPDGEMNITATKDDVAQLMRDWNRGELNSHGATLGPYLVSTLLALRIEELEKRIAELEAK